MLHAAPETVTETPPDQPREIVTMVETGADLAPAVASFGVLVDVWLDAATLRHCRRRAAGAGSTLLRVQMLAAELLSTGCFVAGTGTPTAQLMLTGIEIRTAEVCEMVLSLTAGEIMIVTASVSAAIIVTMIGTGTGTGTGSGSGSGSGITRGIVLTSMAADEPLPTTQGRLPAKGVLLDI